MAITPSTFDGHDISSATYTAYLDIDDEVFVRQLRQVSVQPAGSYPQHVRGDVTPRTFRLHVQVHSSLNANLQQLESWFDTGTEGALVVDFDGADRTLDCVVLRTVRYAESPNKFTALLVAMDPRWRSDALQTDVRAQSTSGASWATLDNDGNAKDDKPLFRIKPTSAKLAADGHLYKAEAVLVNRETRPFVNYAVELTEDWDHAAEVTANRSQADGDDVRVRVDSAEVPRWFGEHTDNDANSTATRLWINLDLAPRKTATLLADTTAGAPATGAALEVQKGGTRGWPRTGAMLIDDEVILYDGISESNASGNAEFQSITRGARNTTAAIHTTSDTIYWVEHRIQILWGHDGATAPEARDELKPMLDLSSNTVTNLRHEWIAFADEDNPGRSMQWARRLRLDDGRIDRVLAPSGSPDTVMDFEYQADGPVAGKPNFNEWFRRFPSGTGNDGGGNVASLTRVVDATMAFLVKGTDDEGNETTLATFRGELASASADVAESANPVYRIGFYARSQRVLGNPEGDLSNSANIPVTSYDTTGQQQITVVGDGEITALILGIANSAADRNVIVSIWSDDGSDAALTRLTTEVTVAVSGSSIVNYEFTLATALPVTAGTKLWIRAHHDGSAGSMVWAGFAIPYEGGIASTGAVSRTFRFAVMSTDLDFDSLVEGADGDVVTVDGLTVYLATAGVPYVNMLARENIYRFSGAVFDNDTTGQAITLRDVVCAIDDEIEIDVAKRTVKNITVTPNESVLAGVDFSDPDEWMRLDPGTNTLDFTEANLVAVTIDSDFRDRYA